MRYPLLFVAAVFASTVALGQEQCATPDETIADPNSITKCAIEDTKDGKKQVSIEVSTRRRVKRTRKNATAIGGLNASTKVENVKKKTLLVGSLELEDNSETIDKIPFNLVEEVPLFDKCKNVPLVKQSRCFEDNVARHVQRNFKYPEEALNNGIEGRVLVQFAVNQDGSVGEIRMRAPKGTELLKEEAERIINKLPKFTPGKHNGKIVKVKYGIPITFKLPKGYTKKAVAKSTPVAKPKKVAKEKVISDAIAFGQVQSIPQFKTCSKAADVEKLNCFNKKMMQHINRNFAYPEAAAQNNIEGKVWVRFIINKIGHVTNITMKGPKGGQLLEFEAKRMVSKLPKFIPGKQDGKAANVSYTMPINFKLQD
ncbi:hypothetical protein WH52_06265 [Tenacibaculum holothuriorum]|uniref:TonB C-terminal domain-containing protein n=1 Tax=Tenacibaculum holothuriorum TaxID=1635173 RepID=A0A1Y2PD28_9FLAO|nr:energy transducer TonB [Tenacibaculum holothuriorum]OSY88362.1 hypothetical protein WH52_06265 [Tenacibaculum holothuriorum]